MPNKKNSARRSTSLNQQKETEERSKKVRMEQTPGGISVKRGRGFGPDPHFTKP